MKMKSIFLIVCGVAILSVLPACESEHRVTTTTTTTEETTVPVATTETHTVRSY
jgi:hypothetical protein